jgi:Zn-finger nucleic acid-binding protein
MSASRECPRCRLGLAAVSLLEGGSVRVDICPQCRGIWFDADELDTVLAAATDDGARIDRHLINALAERNAAPGEVRYIPCPVCSSMMNRCAQGHRSGVVADRCKAHGVWLDGGELETLFDWVAAGGYVLDAQVTEENRREEARHEEARRRRLAEAQSLGEDAVVIGPYARHRSSGWLAEALGDVLDWIVS